MTLDISDSGAVEWRTFEDSAMRIKTSTTATAKICDLDIGFSLRSSGISREHVDLLAQNPDALPPIVVHHPSMRVIDGLHRVHVAQKAGCATVEVQYFEGSDLEAYALSAHLNTGHGLPLSKEDRKAAAARMLTDNNAWSDRFIARLAGLSNKTVSAIRSRTTGECSQSNGRVGCDGRVRPIDPVGGRLKAADLISAEPELSLRELATRAGVSISTARDVRMRLESGRGPIPDRLVSKLESAPKLDQADARTEPLGQTGPQSGNLPVRIDLPGKRRYSESGRNTPGCAPGPTATLLERLRKDPAVRFTEAGRSLVRQLSITHAVLAELRESAHGAPPHCSEIVVQIANTYAEEWNALARTLKEQSKHSPEQWTQSS